MAEQFDFRQEAAEILPDMVTAIELTDIVDGLHCQVYLVSLEGTAYDLNWSVSNGIEIKTIDGAAAEDSGRGYEDLNQLLQNKSPLYQQAFNGKLMEKLMGLQGSSALDRLAQEKRASSDSQEE